MELLPEGSLTTPAGFLAGTAAGGIKKNGLPDVALIYSEQACSAAAVFTRNQVVAAPVIVSRRTLAGNADGVVAIVANSGNANACTGPQGMRNAEQMQRLAATALDCRPDQVLVMSTGVIGVQLPMEKIARGIRQAAGALAAENGPQAAQAIMTTDTIPKFAAVQVLLPEGVVTIGGMAKGAGMIHPDMATLLGVHTTDAVIDPATLEKLLHTAVAASYNRISVDGDTSTNDTVMLLANGASGVKLAGTRSLALFQEALNALTVCLAQQVVRDGEGASKFVEIVVTGVENDRAAHQVANAIATSALVKTAFAGSDANWGRILAAAGRAGVPFNQATVALWVGVHDPGELQLLASGAPTDYAEESAAAIFSEPEFKVLLDLQQGSGKAVVWTSDLTHEYVSINADYRS